MQDFENACNMANNNQNPKKMLKIDNKKDENIIKSPLSPNTYENISFEILNIDWYHNEDVFQSYKKIATSTGCSQLKKLDHVYIYIYNIITIIAN